MRLHPLEQSVQAFLKREQLANRPIVVAVSGGPDSIALLLALHALATNHLSVVHLNHGLRGAESDGDQAFVEEFCRSRGIDAAVERADVRATAAESRENLEAAARRLRYAFFERIATERKAVAVATGHTADDQAETVLHHLLRGTGLRGLRGIARRRPLAAGIDLIRPLIEVTRATVLDYLDSKGVTARQDSTNLDLTLTRNRIRHELLPRLRAEHSPRLTEHLCELAEQAQTLYGELEREARDLLAAAERPRAGTMIVLDAETLSHGGPHIVREVFHLIWAREGWPLGAMDRGHWQRLAEMLNEAEAAHDLPDGVHARRKSRVMQLWREA